jgi:uncharacterized protein
MEDPTTVPNRRVISVTGTGRTSRRPDQADLTLSAEATAANAGDAQRQVSESMRAILDAVGSRVDARDIATQGIGLEPVYDYRESGAKLTGYRANQALAVRVRKLDDLGPVIDAAVGAGATGITAVSLGLADPAEAEAEARTKAVADARSRAEGLAAAAGVPLGELVRLEEGSIPGPPRPMMRMAAEAMTTPVAEGSTEVIVEVRAVFAIG